LFFGWQSGFSQNNKAADVKVPPLGTKQPADSSRNAASDSVRKGNELKKAAVKSQNKVHNEPVFTTDDSIKPANKTIMAFNPSPKRAAMLSAVLPGLGQIYNRKYWKVPLLYAGAALMGYYIGFNNKQYYLFKNAYILRKNGDQSEKTFYSRFNDPQALSLNRDYFRRNRDLLIILCGMLYILNIADATVDAHLMNFNVSDDVNLAVVPSIQTDQMQASIGLGLKLGFK
jgi:Family of unknown function (DUF5683)